MFRKSIFGTLALVLCLALLGSTGAAQDVSKLKFPPLNKLQIPEVERITLDNGLKLYLLPDKSLPVFNIAVRINCGSYLEPADKVGLADVTGTVMRTGGTLKWSGDEIDELLEGIGGSVETSIGQTSGSARVNVLSEYAETGIEVLAEILRRPLFDEDKINLAKVQERSVISRRNDNPQGIVFREFTKAIYGPESVYARNVEYATIDAISRDDLLAFHKEYFKPQNVQMAIWGDYDKEQLLTLIKKYFGDWVAEGEPVPPPPDVDYKFDNKVFRVEKEDVNQTNIVLGHIGGKVTDDDFAARIVMNNILGYGFGSRLFKSVRSREGLAYAVYGVYSSNISYPGMFQCFVSTKSETTIKAVREIIKEIKRMQTDPPDEEEMNYAKDGYLNSFVFNFDSKAEVVNRMMTYDYFGLPEDFLFTQKDQVEAVTPEDVVKAAQDRLRPDALRIMIVGKAEDYEMPLEEAGLGNVVDVDITIPTGEEEKELAVDESSMAKGMEVLKMAVEAAGGLEACKSIKSVSLAGTLTLKTPQGNMTINLEETREFPNKKRSSIATPMGTFVVVRNETTGWKPDATTGSTVPMTEEDVLSDNKENARNILLIFQTSDDPDYKAIYDGTGESNGIECDFVVILSDSDEKICRLALSKADHALVAKSYWGETLLGEGNIEDHYTAFTDVNGFSFPTSTTTSLNGQEIMTLTIDNVTANGEIPAGTFDQP